MEPSPQPLILILYLNEQKSEGISYIYMAEETLGLKCLHSIVIAHSIPSIKAYLCSNFIMYLFYLYLYLYVYVCGEV